jgi:hypothetical protein
MKGLRELIKRVKTVAIAGFLLAAMSFNPWPAEATQHANDSDRQAASERPSRGAQYQRCILHRESRGTNPAPNGSNASGYYQFTPVAWDATVRRMGKPEWAGRHAYTFTRKQQDAVYHAAWRQGNGKFYWSARWGAPYACFPGDTRPMRSE